MRLACNVGLVYSTTTAQLREILSEMERALCAHPKIWPDKVVVRFKELGDSSLNIEVMAWFQTADSGELQLIRIPDAHRAPDYRVCAQYLTRLTGTIKNGGAAARHGQCARRE